MSPKGNWKKGLELVNVTWLLYSSSGFRDILVTQRSRLMLESAVRKRTVENDMVAKRVYRAGPGCSRQKLTNE